MADTIEKDVDSDVEETQTEETTQSSSTEEIDYKALAEAEKARADAAEALIVKNKNIAKRQDDTQILSEERVRELIKEATASKEVSPEALALAEAQKKVKELESKSSEFARALKAKDGVSHDATSAQRDPMPTSEPKLPDNSPLKSYKYMGNGIYAKKLASGKTMYQNTKAMPGQRKTWTD